MKMEEINGDLSVSRDVSAGGNLTVGSHGRFKGNLRVDGWFDAPNVRGADKGWFKSADELREAYPHGSRGWWAEVGADFPLMVYVWSGSGWSDSGRRIIGGAELSALSSRLAEAEGKLALLNTKYTDLTYPGGGIAVGLAEIDSSGLLRAALIPPHVLTVESDIGVGQLPKNLCYLNISDGKLPSGALPDYVVTKGASGKISESLMPRSYATLDSNGFVAAAQIPDYLARAYKIPEIVLQYLFGAFSDDGREYKEVLEDSMTLEYRFAEDTEAWRMNGYHENSPYPDKRYCLYGNWLSAAQAMKVLSDRWVPGVPGLLTLGAGNLPLATKTGDTELSLRYSFCLNYRAYVFMLGCNGWDSVIYPTTMMRAFDGATALRMIVGVIDCSQLSVQSDVMYAFRKASALNYFCLRNIPDAITELDLSDCGDGLDEVIDRQISINGALTKVDDKVSAEAAVNAEKLSTMSYLVKYLGERTKKLTVRLPEGVYDRHFGSLFAEPSLKSKWIDWARGSE